MKGQQEKQIIAVRKMWQIHAGNRTDEHPVSKLQDLGKF